MVITSDESKSENKDFIDEVIKLSILRDDAKSELTEILESIRGRKCLLVDHMLMNIINIIVGDSSTYLSDHGVSLFKDVSIDSNTLINECTKESPENYIYLVKPHLPTMRTVAHQIKSLVNFGVRNQFKIFFVPTQSTVCMHILEEHIDDFEVWERISFKEFRCGFVPLDSDVISLDMDYVFKQCYVDGDLSCLNVIAQAIARLQNIYGVIPNIKSKGVGARKVLQRMMHRRVDEESSVDKEGHHSTNNNQRNEIDTLMILDREVDLVSPLVTPLTYEGLVDEVIGIVNGKIKIDAALLGNEDSNDLSQMKLPSATVVVPDSKKSSPGEKVQLQLNNSDSIYAEIRNLSIERIGSYMQEKAIHIRERYAAFKGNKDASLAEIHEFVKKIPKLTKDFKSLNQHIHIAEVLKQRTDSRSFRDQWQGERAMLEGESYLDQIEEILLADVDRNSLSTILRLLCLQSITSGGLRGNRYDTIRRSIVQTYGFNHLYTLNNLERSGMIKRKDTLLMVETTTQWQLLKKQFRLIDERVNMSKPDDISYVAAGYAPLMPRIIQVLATNPSQHASIVEGLKLLPGPFLDFVQASQPEELVDMLNKSSVESQSTATSTIQSVVNVAADLGNLAASTTKGAFRKENDDSRFIPNVLIDDHSTEKKVMLVVVIGGISLLEIAALRYLSNDPAFPFKILIGTTKIMNASSLLSSLEHSF